MSIRILTTHSIYSLILSYLIAHSAQASDSAKPSVAPQDAIVKLKHGNERFVSGKAKHPFQNRETVEKLSNGQTPHTIILSCSDSRVAPEVVFDQGLGQVFVIRNAGHVPDHTAVASIEYAVEHLGSRLIVVMGHESCGAVKATLTTPAGQSAGSPDLDYLIKQIKPYVASFNFSPADPKFRAAVKANTEGAAAELVRHSEIIRNAVNSNKIKIVEAVYELDSGRVHFNDWKVDDSIGFAAKKLIEKKEIATPAAHGH